MADFCRIVQQLKIERNVLQKDIVKSIGVPLRTYQRYEHGEREPPISILILIADYFDVSLDYLVGRSKNPKRY